MTQENYVLIGAGVLGLLFYGKPLLLKLKSLLPEKPDVIVPPVGTSLSEAVTQIRYYMALQDASTRTMGFEACDVIDGIISEQPLLSPPRSEP